VDRVKRIDKHVSATKRNPGGDTMIAEPCHNFSLRNAREAGFGQPGRQFAEELFIHGATIRGPIFEFATLRDLPEVRQFKNGKLFR
jgi:hypothetical protein